MPSAKRLLKNSKSLLEVLDRFLMLAEGIPHSTDDVERRCNVGMVISKDRFIN